MYSLRSGGALQRQHRQPQDPLIELADATAVFGRPLQGSAAGPSDPQVATMLELVNRTRLSVNLPELSIDARLSSIAGFVGVVDGIRQTGTRPGGPR